MAFTKLWLSMSWFPWNSHLLDTSLQGTPLMNFMTTQLTAVIKVMLNMDRQTDRQTDRHSLNTNHSCLLCNENLVSKLNENCCHLLYKNCWYNWNRTYLENKAQQSQTQSKWSHKEYETYINSVPFGVYKYPEHGHFIIYSEVPYTSVLS